MIPVDNFYNVLYANFCKHARLRYLANIVACPTWNDMPVIGSDDSMPTWYCNDQEPILIETIKTIIDLFRSDDVVLSVFINSEYSDLKDQLVSQHGMLDWYYFYHGFAALDWYRDYKYFPKERFKFEQTFMSLNHLMTRDRSYRLTLVANYIDNDLLDKGFVSLPLNDVNGTIKDELFSQDSLMSKDAKKLVFKNVMPLGQPLVADTYTPHGALSAITISDYEFSKKAFWHVVSETVFYHKKLHLTEKIFKPIIARRPFLLVAAPGNLAYLKSYGFKTFDKWVDESYDTEQDDDKRIQLIVAQLKKLCNYNRDELYSMQEEMDDILDYNFNHFYNGDFQRIIVDEMLDNFKKLPIPMDDIDLDAVRARFLR